MAGLSRGTHCGLLVALALTLCTAMLHPQTAVADTDLVLGGQARVAYADGDDVRLRQSPGYNAETIRFVPERTVVEVVDGPVAADDGSLWYQVTVEGDSGYIAADYLALQGGEAAPLDEPSPAEETSAPTKDETGNEGDAGAPPGEVTGTAVIGGTNGQGVRCRAAANADGAVIAVLADGEPVDLTGDAVDGWQPVNCAGQGGFVSAQFVVLGDAPPAPDETPATEEVPTETAAPEPTTEPTEEVPPTPEAVITEEPTVEATETAIAEPTEEPTTEETETPAPEPTEEATEEPTQQAPEETATETEIPESTEVVEETPPVETETAAPETETPAIEPETPSPETETATATAEPETPGAETATATATAETATPGLETETPAAETETPTLAASPTPDDVEEPTVEPTAPALGTPVLAGTALVIGTNGGGLRCRVEPRPSATVLATLAEFSVVQIRGDAARGWQPVVCDGRDGFVKSDFLLLDRLGAQPEAGNAGGDVSQSVGEATVAGTNGGGLRCRSKASADASIITLLREGGVVKLRSGSSGEWQAVRCAERNGFVANAYLSYGGAVSAAATGGPSAAAVSSTGKAKVAGTDGDGLRCRNGAGYDAGVITTLTEGKTVELRGNPRGVWQGVWCAGRRGYVHKDYLGRVSRSSGSSGSGSSSSSGSATVSGTGGDGVRLRSRASSSASVIMVLAEGTKVKLRRGSSGSWTAVTYQGSNGFIHRDYLKKGSRSSSPVRGSSTGGGGLSKGDRARVTSALNLRYDPNTRSGVAAVAPANTVVKITGSARGSFFPVSWDGLKGYMHGDYLKETSAALSQRGGSSSGGGGGGGGSATGNAMVDFAMDYLGYPYVWATAGPSSFDCSGFTHWVTRNVLGKDIGRGLFTQVAAGSSVSRSNLRPGDLVFFQNTYTWGLSHVGIYVGNGRFIHAQNESTGVVISDLSSPYYSSRWYGAVRLR